MAESILWLHMFISDHRSLEYIIVFFGVILGGGFTLFILGFLAAQNVIPVLSLFIISFLAVFSADAVWFFFGQTSLIKRVVLHRYTNPTISVVAEAITKASKGNQLKAFIFAKFLIATPVVLIMYLSKASLKFREFIYYNTPAIIIWILVATVLGYLPGLGFEYLTDIFQNLSVAVGFILTVVIVLISVHIWLSRRFIKKS